MEIYRTHHRKMNISMTANIQTFRGCPKNDLAMFENFARAKK
jgi:hypothetical protein